MIRRLIIAVLACVFLVGLTTPVFARDDDVVLDEAQKKLQPMSIQKEQEEDQDNLINIICRLVTVPLICPGTQLYQTVTPQSMSIEEVTDTEKEQLATVLSELNGDVAGTQSAQVLGLTETFQSVTNFLSGNGLFVDEKSAFPTRRSWAQALGSIGSDAGEAIDNTSRGAYLPQALQDKKSLASAPTETPPPGSQPSPGVTGSVSPTNPPVPTQTVNNQQVSYHTGGGYKAFYQTDPFYARIPLPAGCTYINAACGPFTIVNALVNSGINVTPQEIINKYYPNAGCDGTSMSQGKQIMSRYAEFEYEYVYSGGWYTQAQVVKSLRNYTDNGWMVWGHGSFMNSKGNWIGHHFLIVDVSSDGRILSLDPYYGWGRSVPGDHSGLTVRYENALAFRRI